MLYHKIDGLFKRNPDNLKEILWGQYRNPVVGLLADAPIWVATEKIDGTNIRVEWDGHRISFGGRTDKAEIPKPLLTALEEQWHRPGVEELFEEKFGEIPVTIVGEGYGPKIQNGGKYRDDPAFVVFDVAVNGTYLSDENARDVASSFDAAFVPTREASTLTELADEVRAGLTSWYGDFEPEGLVARTVEPLYDQRGNRLIVKLKAVDLR